ncbi:MAG: branched-chain amino acid ABC transporter permease, partial [Elsteraceae bacterium]
MLANLDPATAFVLLLNGLASASTLFIVASGLSIIFGVTRIVNFAHGSFYMLGAFIAYTLVTTLPRTPLGFWGGVAAASVIVGLIGVLMEMVILRRIYRAPELFQLLATFGVVLVIQDVALKIWGAEELLGPRVPGLRGAVEIMGKRFPEYNLAIIAIGPVVLLGLWLLFHRTRWGTLVRAATQDREMVAALGVNQRWLFTSVFFVGSMLAGLGGALQVPRDAANLAMDLNVIAEAFVVVVVGGMGSVTGAFLAALLIGVLQAFGILIFPKATLILVFLVMAVVLVVRPYGLLGKPEGPQRGVGAAEPM